MDAFDFDRRPDNFRSGAMEKNQCENYGAYYGKSVKIEYSFFYGIVCRESNDEGWKTVPNQSLYIGGGQ